VCGKLLGKTRERVRQIEGHIYNYIRTTQVRPDGSRPWTRRQLPCSFCGENVNQSYLKKHMVVSCAKGPYAQTGTGNNLSTQATN